MIRIVNVKMGKQLHCKVEQGKCLTAKRIQDQPILRGRPLAGGPCHSLDVNTFDDSSSSTSSSFNHG